MTIESNSSEVTRPARMAPFTPPHPERVMYLFTDAEKDDKKYLPQYAVTIAEHILRNYRDRREVNIEYFTAQVPQQVRVSLFTINCFCHQLLVDSGFYTH